VPVVAEDVRCLGVQSPRLCTRGVVLAASRGQNKVVLQVPVRKDLIENKAVLQVPVTGGLIIFLTTAWQASQGAMHQ
jgi:hypothetical protein